MNKKLIKLLCLCLALMLTVSSVSFAQESEYATDEEIIITEEISDSQEVFLQSEPLKAVYLEYKIGGKTMAEDTAIGDINYATDIPDILYPITPSASNGNMSWCADGQIADWGAKRVEIGGYWASMTAPYYRKDRPTSAYATGNMPFALGNSFTNEYNQAVFEVEYFDNGTKPFSIIYMNTADAKTSSGVNFTRTGTDTWKTQAVLSGTDAHLYRNRNTGLGVGNTSPLRINSNGEIYVKAFRVYTPGYRELAAAAEGVELEIGETVDADFELPYSADANVVWTSSDEDVISVSGNNAIVNRHEFENKECTLTARVEKDGYYIDKEYTLSVKALYQELNDAMSGFEITDADPENVTADFELPTLDDRFTVKWTSSDNDLIEIDGNTAIVKSNPFLDQSCTLTARIYMGEIYVEKSFEINMPIQYKEVVFTEYIIGETLADDTSYGELKYDTVAGDIDLSRVEPGAETSNLPLVTYGVTHDWASLREMHDGRWASVTGRYARPARKERPIADGNMPFDTGDAFSELKNLTIEVEYFDNVSGSFIINYKNSDSTSRKVAVTKNGDKVWKTCSVDIDDAYFVPGKTGMGSGNQSDFRLEAGNSDLIVGAVRVYTRGYEKIADAADSVTFDGELRDITESFELPAADGAEIIWTSSDESVVKISDGIAMVYGDDNTEKTCTITARIAANGVYTDKTFDVHLAKRPKKAVITGTPSITENAGVTTVTYNLTETGNMVGTNVVLVLNSVAKSTDEIKERKIVSKKVTGNNTVISASIEVGAGCELKYYITDANGAPLYNLAPSAIENYRGVSKVSGAGFVWDHAHDDHFIKEYVLYDAYGNEYARTQENSFVIPDIQPGELYGLSVEGFDHEGYSTGRTALQTAGLYEPSFCDLSKPETNAGVYNDVYFCTVSKSINEGDNYSEVVSKTDAVTGEERICRKTVNRTSLGKHNTFLYFRADRDTVDDSVRDVTIIVEYFDEGTADVNIQYNAEDGAAGKAKHAFRTTGTNTWKTAVIRLTDAKFTAPSSLTSCDFRLSGGNNGEICVSKVTILPTENY